MQHQYNTLAHDDGLANAILETVRMPILSLDEELRVKSANDAFLLHFRVSWEETIGRLVYELGNGQWDIPDLRRLLDEILPGNSSVSEYRVEHDFELIGRRIMNLNARRIERDGQPDLILLTISDDTEKEALRAELEGRIELADKLTDSVREGLLILCPDLRVHSASGGFYEMFNVTPAETIGRLVYDLGNGQWHIPELRELLEEILPSERSFDDYSVTHVFEGIGVRMMLLNGRRLDHMNLILLAVRDVTGLRITEERLSEELEKARLVQQLSSSLVSAHDPQPLYERIVDAAMSLMEADAASIQILDPAGERLVLVANRNFPPDSEAFWRFVDANSSSACGEALRKQERVVVTDIETCSFLEATVDLEQYRRSGLRAVQSTPLVTRAGKPVGMISTHWKDARRLAEKDFTLLDVLSRQAADLMERSQSEELLRESEQRYRTLFSAMGEGFCLVEVRFDSGRPDCKVIEANKAFYAQTSFPESVLGRWLREAAPALEEHWYEAYGHVARTGEAVRFEQHSGLLERWFEVHAFSVGRPEACRVAILFNNISERKEAEEHRDILMREINHRAKNMLAVVLAIARASAGGDGNFLRSFQNRLMALSANQDLLISSEWQGVGLHDLIRAQLAHLEDLLDERIAINGPPIIVSSRAAETLGMALHELATNAGKYGALSGKEGRVALAWKLRMDSDRGARFHIEWRETDGPAVVPPKDRGFGSTVIEKMAAANLSAEVTLDYAASGLVWTLDAPADDCIDTSGNARADYQMPTRHSETAN